MVSSNRHPVYLLNKYVWEVLKLNFGLDEDMYGGLTPIVPANMEPELTAFNKPFLVYGYSEDMTPDVYAMRGGSLSYAVWSASVGEVNTILNTIRAAMEQHDDTARRVNAWTTSLGGNNIGIRFGDIHIGYLEGPSPEESESGRHAGIITIRYQYFADYEVILP